MRRRGTSCMSPSPLCGEMVGRATFDRKTHMNLSDLLPKAVPRPDCLRESPEGLLGAPESFLERPRELPGELSREVPGEPPRELPGQLPGELPGEPPGEFLGEFSRSFLLASLESFLKSFLQSSLTAS